LFDLIKENLTDQSDSESLYNAVTKFMYSTNKEEYRKTFEKWIQRIQLCIDNQGDYFEHLIKQTIVELVSVFLFCFITIIFLCPVKYMDG